MESWGSPSLAQLVANPGQVLLHDSRTGELRPAGANGQASMYVCGITPYDATHLGHAATYLAFDLLHRVWRDAGFTVSYVQNVTDIDDPLLERAAQTGQDWREIAQRETALFFSDMAALKVLPPDHYESAVESIPDVVALVQRMSEQSKYQVDDDWYFHSPVVGDICGWSREQMETIFAQRGGDPSLAGKRDPLDSLLWRAARAGEPAWESALGAGRPGWHIECVAIAMRDLDMPLSVQGGGRDLVFPHHDMCNAQVVALTGQPLADVFAHAGLIGYQGEKMSKSLGNLVLVSQLRNRGVNMSALRLALTQGHYREDREWTEDLLAAAENRLHHWHAHSACNMTNVLGQVREALRHDLDTPSALAIIDDWCHSHQHGAGGVAEEPAEAALATVADALLGVSL